MYFTGEGNSILRSIRQMKINLADNRVDGTNTAKLYKWLENGESSKINVVFLSDFRHFAKYRMSGKNVEILMPGRATQKPRVNSLFLVWQRVSDRWYRDILVLYGVWMKTQKKMTFW